MINNKRTIFIVATYLILQLSLVGGLTAGAAAGASESKGYLEVLSPYIPAFLSLSFILVLLSFFLVAVNSDSPDEK